MILHFGHHGAVQNDDITTCITTSTHVDVVNTLQYCIVSGLFCRSQRHYGKHKSLSVIHWRTCNLLFVLLCGFELDLVVAAFSPVRPVNKDLMLEFSFGDRTVSVLCNMAST